MFTKDSLLPKDQAFGDSNVTLSSLADNPNKVNRLYMIRLCYEYTYTVLYLLII